jgi:hypothetical protein
MSVAILDEEGTSCFERLRVADANEAADAAILSGVFLEQIVLRSLEH